MAKPSDKISGWASYSSGVNRVKPTSTKITSGFGGGGERPPAQFLNWLSGVTADWLDYLDTGSFAGGFALDGVTSPSALTSGSTTNDYNPTNLATSSTLRLSTTGGNVSLTGLQGTAAGRLITLINVDATFNVFLRNENAGSTSGNRFHLTYSGLTGDVTIPPSGSVTLFYDPTTLRWRVLASNLAAMLATQIFPGSKWSQPSASHTAFLGSNGGGHVGFTLAASASKLTMPITLPIGATITGYSVKVNKTSNGSNTVAARIYKSGIGSDAAQGSGSSNNANNPGAISLAETGLSISNQTDTACAIVFVPGGATGDTLFAGEVTFQWQLT